jgi:hypothetical protein
MINDEVGVLMGCWLWRQHRRNRSVCALSHINSTWTALRLNQRLPTSPTAWPRVKFWNQLRVEFGSPPPPVLSSAVTVLVSYDFSTRRNLSRKWQSDVGFCEKRMKLPCAPHLAPRGPVSGETYRTEHWTTGTVNILMHYCIVQDARRCNKINIVFKMYL